MVSVQIVNVFDSEYIMIKNNFLTGANDSLRRIDLINVSSYLS